MSDFNNKQNFLVVLSDGSVAGKCLLSPEESARIFQSEGKHFTYSRPEVEAWEKRNRKDIINKLRESVDNAKLLQNLEQLEEDSRESNANIEK